MVKYFIAAIQLQYGFDKIVNGVDADYCQFFDDLYGTCGSDLQQLDNLSKLVENWSPIAHDMAMQAINVYSRNDKLDKLINLIKDVCTLRLNA